MGNVLKWLGAEEGHAAGDHYPYYRPTSRPQPHYQPSYHHQAHGHYGVTAATVGVAALDQYILNINSTSMTAVPSRGHLQGSTEVLLGNRVPAPKNQCNTEDIDEILIFHSKEGEDIDESSAEELCDGKSYAKANEMLIQVRVLGTTKTFWRLSDEATRITRKLALILKRQHSAGKYLTAPLRVSNVWVSSEGSVKLRGVSFSFERLQDDYKNLSRVLRELIRISGGHITKLPPDYKEFLTLLESDTLVKDEFFIVNNPALLPMSNRTEVFLMLYDRIVKCLYRARDKAKREKAHRILSKLPYKDDWLDTATANREINQYVDNVQNKYDTTKLVDHLRLNRNVRSHLHEYNDENFEEILYCEWPELLMAMAKMLHMEGEFQDTQIRNKFGCCA